MSIVDGTKIVAPVGYEDVRRVLGERWLDTGRLCTSDKINKWARYKPMRIDQPQDITDAQRKKSSYGINNIPQFTNMSLMALKAHEDAMLVAAGYESNYFTYNKPDAYIIKRITDFVGYDHKAEAPLRILVGSGFEQGGYTQISAGYTATTTSGMLLTDLSLYPLTHLDGYYLGVIMANEYGGYIDSVFPDKPIKYFPTPNFEFSHDAVKSILRDLVNRIVVCPILSANVTSDGHVDWMNVTGDKPLVPLTFASEMITLVREYEKGDISMAILAAWHENPDDEYVNVRYKITNNRSFAWPDVSLECTIHMDNGVVCGALECEDFTLNGKETLTREVQIPIYDPAYLPYIDYAENYLYVNNKSAEASRMDIIQGDRFDCTITKAQRNATTANNLDITYSIKNLTGAMLTVSPRFEIYDSEGVVLKTFTDESKTLSGNGIYDLAIADVGTLATKIRLELYENGKMVALAERDITD